MRTNCSILALAAAGALLTPMAANAQAQTQSSRPGTVEEVIVTAGKREQTLQDVPVSVAVVTGETIKDLSIQNLDELSQYVPGLTITEGGEQTGISIRGFGASLNFGIDQSVGLFIDEIYAGRERQFRSTFLDIGRIEVLKGPQGTLFGKNTIAGAIIIATGQPTQDPSLQLRGEYSPTTNRRALEAILNGPITSTLSGRLAARWSKDDGYIRNTLTGDDEEQEEDKIIRGTLLWEPTDKLAVRTKLEYSEYDRIGRNFVISEISGLAVGRPLTTSPTTLLPITPADVGLAQRLSTYRFYDPTFDVGLDYTTSKQRETAHVESSNAVVDVSYDLGFGTIRSITGYSAFDSNDQRDVDWSPTPFLFEPITQNFSQWSQEFRIVSDVGERFDYVAGLYWFKTDFFVDRRTDVDINLFFSPIENRADRKYSSLRFLDQTAETYSAYAQGTYHIIPDVLHLTAGVRWMRETKTATDRLDMAEYGSTRFLNESNPADAALLAVARALNPGIASTRHSFRGESTEENIIPEAKISWDINDDLMVYASATRGYKGGGFNSNSNTQNAQDFGFRPEKATGMELGGKARLMDRTMNLNFAFFRQDFEDLQLSIWQGNGFFLTNAGSARSQGVEADVRWQTTERLQLSGAVSLVDARYTETVLAACNIGQLNFGQPGCFLIPAPTAANPAATRPVQDFNNRRFAPRYTASLGVGYVQPLSDSMEVLFRGDATFRARGQSALDPTIVQPPVELLDLSATLRPTDDSRWNISLLVQNVLDQRYYYFEFEAPAQTGTRIGFPAPPRRWTIRASYEF
jgi:iron complex outermembrane recepter protein